MTTKKTRTTIPAGTTKVVNAATGKEIPFTPKAIRTYHGIREGDITKVYVDGKSLPPCFDLVNHSPSGFEWGYGGSGPAQLAFAILFDHYGGDKVQTESQYQMFKFAFIANIKLDEWSITTTNVDLIIRDMG